MKKGKLTDKLNRFHDQVVDPKPVAHENKLPESYLKLAEKLGGCILSNHAGSYCLVKKQYPLTYHHGRMHLADVAANSGLPLAASGLPLAASRLPLAAFWPISSWPSILSIGSKHPRRPSPVPLVLPGRPAYPLRRGGFSRLGSSG
ncbi:MAG: hypothetical protein KAT79_03165 [candidate division Zixibacteria bacterium]|nr:hypothetical protein [candidate division Zixibacteria bacterium]